MAAVAGLVAPGKSDEAGLALAPGNREEEGGVDTAPGNKAEVGGGWPAGPYPAGVPPEGGNNEVDEVPPGKMEFDDGC